MQYDGDLRITLYNIKDFPDLQRVTGDLTIDACDVDFPILQYVGKTLLVTPKSHNFHADQLQQIDGDAYLFGSHGRYTNLENVKGIIQSNQYNFIPKISKTHNFTRIY